jgi:pimeloyl-ACP methyl ester carboxylesterase
MTEITHRQIQTNGINLHIAEAGEGPLVLMVHGFPELWYSYRHQLPALADAGYHAVAPDVRGYGDSDTPHEVEAYRMREMVADYVGLLDALDEEQAVIVGHDWGSMMAWTCAALRPDRFRAVVGMSVPYLPRSPIPPLQMMEAMFANNFFYILYFQEEGVAEAEFEADIRDSLLKFMYFASGDFRDDDGSAAISIMNRPKDSKLFDGIDSPDRLPIWLSEEDLDTFAAAFEKTGFRGGLNRYRNMDRDWEEIPELAAKKIEQPALFIAGDKDGAATFAPMDPMKEFVTDLRKLVMLPGCGHWTQQERPAEVNAELIEFLNGL